MGKPQPECPVCKMRKPQKSCRACGKATMCPRCLREHHLCSEQVS